MSDLRRSAFIGGEPAQEFAASIGYFAKVELRQDIYPIWRNPSGGRASVLISCHAQFEGVRPARQNRASPQQDVPGTSGSVEIDSRFSATVDGDCADAVTGIFHPVQ